MLSAATDSTDSVMALFRPEGIRILVNFDGKDVICFFDTGSPFTIVENDTYFGKYKEQGTVPIVTMKNQVTPSKQIIIKKTKVGDVEKLNQKTLVTTKPMGAPYGPCILGLDVFEQAVVDINFQKNHIKFIEKIPAGKTTQEMQINSQGHIVIPLMINAHKTPAVFDTGMSALTLSSDLLKMVKQELTFYKSYDSGKDPMGKPLSYDIYKASKIGLLNLSASPNMPVAVVKDSKIFETIGTKAIMGFQMISQYNWQFDFKNKRWVATDY